MSIEKDCERKEDKDWLEARKSIYYPKSQDNSKKNLIPFKISQLMLQS